MHDARPLETASTAAAVEAVADANGAALQADIRRALAALHRIPAEEFTGADHAYRVELPEYQRSARPPEIGRSMKEVRR